MRRRRSRRARCRLAGAERTPMNLIVYVSDALRTDHVGCYGARTGATRRRSTSSRLGGVRFDQALAAAPWTARRPTSMITGLYPHHHGYLHWDASSTRAPDAVHGRRRVRLRDRQLRLRRELPLQGLPRRERRRARASRSTAPSRGSASIATSRSSSGSTAGRRTCPTTSTHAERKEWQAAKADDHRRHPVRQRVGARGAARVATPRRSSARRSFSSPVPRAARRPRPPRATTVARLRRRPRRVVGRAVRRQAGGEGHLPHARRDALRGGRRGAADPLGARVEPGRRSSPSR